MGKYEGYVHALATEAGTRYVVAKWNLQRNQYEVPMTAEERRLTGAYAYYGPLSYLPCYATRRQALRRARLLFGNS